MKKVVFLGVSSFLLLCSTSYAGLLFKMEAPKTSLLPDETVTVTLSAYADDAAAIGQNGLNAWQMDALVSTGGVVEVVSGTVVFLAPSPWSTNSSDTGFTSINAPNTGNINYLRLITADLPQDSDVGVGGYTPIARFDIKAIGTAGQSVTYTIPTGEDFLGILAGGTVLYGVLNSADSQTVFTIVPEPSSLLIFSGLGIIRIFRRSRK